MADETTFNPDIEPAYLSPPDLTLADPSVDVAPVSTVSLAPSVDVSLAAPTSSAVVKSYESVDFTSTSIVDTALQSMYTAVPVSIASPGSVGVAAQNVLITPTTVTKQLYSIYDQASPDEKAQIADTVTKAFQADDNLIGRVTTFSGAMRTAANSASQVYRDPSTGELKDMVVVVTVNGASMGQLTPQLAASLEQQVIEGSISPSQVTFSPVTVAKPPSLMDQIYAKPVESIALITALGSLGLGIASLQNQKKQAKKQESQYTKLYDVNGDGQVTYADTMLSLQQQTDMSVAAQKELMAAEDESEEYSGPPAAALNLSAPGS